MLLSLDRIVFGVLLLLVAWLSSFRSLVSWSLHPVSRGLTQQAWTEVVYWLVAAILVLWLLIREGKVRRYVGNLRKQPLLILFISICALSLLWSGDPVATLFRVHVLVISTMVAAYLGMRCSLTEFLGYLSWFAALVVLYSFYMAFAEPAVGLQPYYGPGVWRGAFWNRNHLGAVGALCAAVLLMRIVDGKNLGSPTGTTFFAFMYLGALFAVYNTRSAAGYLLTLILHTIVGLFLAWRLVATRMKRRHYLVAALVGIAIVIIVAANLDSIFRLFNRDTTLTGRTRLWAYLLDDFANLRPLLGHGFGSLWGDPAFRALASAKLGFVPVIGDNGFIDILLGVGAIGLTAFLAVYVVAWNGAVRHLTREQATASGLPLVVMSFSLFANISFSLLLEIEVLVWGLIVFVLFSAAQREDRQVLESLPDARQCRIDRNFKQ